MGILFSSEVAALICNSVLLADTGWWLQLAHSVDLTLRREGFIVRHHLVLQESLVSVERLTAKLQPLKTAPVRGRERANLLSNLEKRQNIQENKRRQRDGILLSAVKKSESYGCETWTLTLREEQRLRVFENKVLRKIFGAKRDEVTGEWRKLHITEMHALYSSPDIIRNIKSRRLRWAGHVARMGESRTAYRVLIGRPEGKTPLGRKRRRWEDDIKMDLRVVGYDDRDWINLAQDRDQWWAYVRAVMNLRVP
ncbi:hypothetical protein ANN_24533 [Periplaneta americana]|uniref:Endonuclease-reverse transcriptase n=1 Tax=Periplaneta americana TaxID=6978 RepID=A0ABQ8S3N2_PERAM|nr:hypothetical protein ANN_24533 [Periplaneta americana]